jgi:hypothetical protein
MNDRILCATIALFVGFAASACSSDSDSSNGGDGGGASTGGATSAGGSGTGGAETCNTDVTRFTAGGGDPVSFKDDIMPILGFSCTGSECHGESVAKGEAGFYVGPKCDYQADGKWTCAYATPPTADDIAAVYASVTGVATTVTTGDVKRIEPGDPSKSFLLDKTSDTQNDHSYECKVVDSSHSAMPTPCGDYMPQTGDPLCRSGKTGQKRWDAIAQWAKNGAPNN